MTDADIQRIVAYLHANRQDMVDLLQRLARIESPSDDPAAVAPALGLLTAEMERADMVVRAVAGRLSAGTLYARSRQKNPKSPFQLLLCHCDTVWPVGTIQHMPVRVEGHTVRGPGVARSKPHRIELPLIKWLNRSLAHTTIVTRIC